MRLRILHLFVFLLIFASAFAQQVNITFELNSATIPEVDPAGLYIAGGSGFGSPGDNELTDPDGDGIYSITIQRDQGFSSYFIFLNGNCPDYSCKENIAGLPCSDPANFNDRFLPAVMADTTILACYETCENDGSCTVVTDSVDITFELNTSEIDVDPSGVFIAGGGNFGNPGDNPMVDPDGDGIYTFTTRKKQGFTSYYTFTNGNCPDFSCKEDLEGLPCGDPNAFNDRLISSVMEDTTVKACFGNCADDGTCIPNSIAEIQVNENLFTIVPTVVSNYTNISFDEKSINQLNQITVMNSTGQIVKSVSSQNASYYQLNTSQYTSGVYYVNVRNSESMLTKRFIVQN